MTDKPLGVGLIGAGPVAQSIHIPTLLRLPDLFEVRCVMDIDPRAAGLVAARTGGRATTSVDDLLADPGVDVVAICTPAQLHARQVVDALGANKKGVFCEKALATSRAEAERIRDAARTAGVPLVVGAMHSVDPAWVAVREAWGGLVDSVHTVRSRIMIPQNTRYEDWATEFPPRQPWHPERTTDPAVRRQTVTDGILGLASHALPHVRTFLPDFAELEVTQALALHPWGYLVVLQAGDRVAELIGLAHNRWNPEWTFEAFAPEASLHIQLPPSFVHAGSGVATLRDSAHSLTFGPYPRNGYELEWRGLAETIAGRLDAIPPLDAAVDDLIFAVDIVDRAMDLIDSEESAA